MGIVKFTILKSNGFPRIDRNLSRVLRGGEDSGIIAKSKDVARRHMHDQKVKEMTDEIDNRLPAAIENTSHFDRKLKSGNIEGRGD